MTNLKELKQIIDEQMVAQSNFFRFETPEMFEFAIKHYPDLTIARLLKNCFSMNLYSAKETIKRVKEGESFLTVTNDLNIRKLL